MTPVALFGISWLLLVLVILGVWSLKRRDVERCDRCGGEWKLTAHGNGYHLCTPHRDRVSQ